MSDNIPFEVQAEIIKRLPDAKSLIQFRSVSKSWKSLIDSSDFIAHYRGELQHLLVSYKGHDESGTLEQKYVSIVDDHTFPQHKLSLTPPRLVNMLEFCSIDIVGTSHVVLCLRHGYPSYSFGPFPETAMVVLWNLTIRKEVAVVVPHVKYGLYETVLGFGVSGKTKDPKIVKITHINSDNDVGRLTRIPWQVEVFTLSTGVWRNPYGNVLRKSIKLLDLQVVVNELLYWLATDRITRDGEFVRSYNLIISFDLVSEEFGELSLPDCSAHRDWDQELHISKIWDSLVVLERDDLTLFVVWLMEDGVSKSFTKLLNIYTPNAAIFGVLEFRITGDPIIEIVKLARNAHKDPASLVVYEINSKHIRYIGIPRILICSLYFVSSYVETLILLGQPDNIVYDNGKHYIKS